MDAYLSGDDGGSFAANESLVLFALHLGVAQRIGRHLALHVQAEPGIGMRASSDGPAFGLGTKAGLFFF
jgi:hypothetical protein